MLALYIDGSFVTFGIPTSESSREFLLRKYRRKGVVAEYREVTDKKEASRIRREMTLMTLVGNEIKEVLGDGIVPNAHVSLSVERSAVKNIRRSDER